jgi:hypothetical protein
MQLYPPSTYVAVIDRATRAGRSTCIVSEEREKAESACVRKIPNVQCERVTSDNKRECFLLQSVRKNKCDMRTVHHRQNHCHIIMKEDCLCHEELQTIWQVVRQKPHRKQSQIHWLTAGRVSDRAGRRTNDRRRPACPPSTPRFPVVHRRRRCAVAACAVGTNVVF